MQTIIDYFKNINSIAIKVIETVQKSDLLGLFSVPNFDYPEYWGTYNEVSIYQKALSYKYNNGLVLLRNQT